MIHSPNAPIVSFFSTLLFCMFHLTLFVLNGRAETASDYQAWIQSPAGWQSIMPPEDLSGWHEYPWFEGDRSTRDPASLPPQWLMNPEDAILTCTGKGAHSRFLTEAVYGNFIFHLEWRFPQEDPSQRHNSGVFVRMEKDQPHRWVMHQIETGAHQKRTGFLKGGVLDPLGMLFGLATVVYQDGKPVYTDSGIPRSWRNKIRCIIPPPEDHPWIRKNTYDIGVSAPVYPPGKWNTYDIICIDQKIIVFTNGEESCRTENARVAQGSIGLEAEGWEIQFRNMRVKTLE